MTSGLVHATIRRSNRNLLILSFVGALVVLGIAGLSWRYLYNFFLGPATIEKQALLTLEDPNTPLRYFVDVEGDDTAIDTEVEMVSRSKYGTEKTSAYYMALPFDDRFLLVKTSQQGEMATYTGALVEIPGEEKTEIIDDIEALDPDYKGMFLPYMLDATGFHSGGYVGFVFGVPILIACVVGAVKAIRRSSDLSLHPVMRRLTRFGEPQYVAGEIENELLAPQTSVGNLRVTRNWVVQSTSAGFDATKLTDIVWLYKHVTQRRVNGIPAGKTFAAHVCDSHGTKIEITGKNEQVVNDMLSSVCQAAPWALVGYDEDIARAWQKQRAELAATVTQRRQQMAQA